MLLVQKHPEWSNAKIARKVGIHRSTLSRSPEYKAAAGMARRSQGHLPKGHITTDSETKLRGVEAVAPVGGQPDDRSDRGQPIPRSKYFREYCAGCGDAIKVPVEKVGKNPICDDCLKHLTQHATQRA